MRRRIDEIEYRPSIGLLHSDGSITRQYLECKLDRFADADKLGQEIKNATGVNLKGFISELRKAGDNTLDFVLAVKNWMQSHKQPSGVEKLVLEAIGDLHE